MTNTEYNNRILIIDDNKSIHMDFDKILSSPEEEVEETDMQALEMSLFAEISKPKSTGKESIRYQLDHAYSGEEGVEMVKAAGLNPYAMAFVDQRMPPGIDGMETIARIWEVAPNIEIIICTAYSDYSWHEIIEKIGITDRLLILKKPFDPIEVKQIAMALAKKWNLSRQAETYSENLEIQVKAQTHIISSMFDFANKLHSFKDMDSILTSILIMITKFIHSARISIMLLNEDKESLYISKAIGIPEDIIAKTKIKIGESIAGKVFDAGKPMIVNNLIQEGFTASYSAYNSFISTPFICSPLMGNRVKLGVINVTNKEGDQPFTEEDINILSYISYTSAIALNNHLNEKKAETSLLGTIQALADAIEAKDNYTGSHSARVAEISTGIGRELGLGEEDLKHISFAGILHDIGKIGIPESILCKEGRLTTEELNIIRTHPEIGEHILKNVSFYQDTGEIIRHHHERLDGTGYPDGLKGEKISLGARIIAVADCFDAMNSDRVYRPKKEMEVILKELKEISGTHLDENCVQALFRYLEKNNTTRFE